MQDEIVSSLPRDNVALTEPMMHHLIEGLINNNEIDRAIFLFQDLRARGIKLRARTFHLIISTCITYHEAEEAFKVLLDLKESLPESPIEDRVYWRVLQSCAREGFVRPLWINTNNSYSELYIVGNTYNVYPMKPSLKDSVYMFYRQRRETDILHSPLPSLTLCPV